MYLNTEDGFLVRIKKLGDKSYEFTDFGILTKIGDPECLAEVISLLIEDNSLISNYKINSRKRISVYSIENIVGKYIQNIRGIL